MQLPRTLVTAALGLGCALALLLPACSGGGSTSGQAAATASEDLLDLGGPAARAIFDGAPPVDPVELPAFDAIEGDPTRAELDATIAFWAERAERDPRDFVALNSLGGSYIRRARLTGDVGDYARARTAFEGSVASNRTRNLGGLAGLAHVAVFTHRFEEARDLAHEALAIKPNDAYALWILGDAELALGRYEDARAAYTDPAALNETLPAHARLAFLDGLEGELDAAELQWTLAIAADTGRQPEEAAWVHTQAGNFYLDAGRLEQARTHYDLALAAVPGNHAALAGRANLAIALGQLGEATRIYAYLVERRPLTAYAVVLGELYEATGRPDLAADQYDLVLAIDQLQRAAGIVTDLQVARFLVSHGEDPETALVAAERAYDARPGVEATDTLAWAHYRLGDYDTAKRYSDRVLELGARRPVYLAHAGLIAAARGDHDRATSLLAEVQAINPRYSVAEAPLVAAAFEALQANDAAVAAR